VASHQYSYQTLRDKFMPQLKRSRDREVRTKIECVGRASKNSLTVYIVPFSNQKFIPFSTGFLEIISITSNKFEEHE
jgi:hypothetical protein